MAKDNNSYRKESFRLWWEYLKRGEEYKKVVDAFNEAENYIEGYLIIHNSKEFPNSVVHLFDEFGDIYEKPFDEWWEKNQSRYLRDRVEDYSQIIGKDVGFLYSVFEELGESEPSAEDFEKDFLQSLDTTDQNSLYLKLTLTKNGGIDDLMKEIKEMIKEKKKEIELELSLTQPLRLEELERYLRVYDLKTYDKKKIRKIAEIVYPKRSLNESLERSIYIDLANARQIIKNAARGVFPGKY